MDRMDYFLELYGGLPRAGPGGNRYTRQAFAMMEDLPPRPRVLDVGCGPGAQTLVLARISGGQVVAVDLLPAMLERVAEAAREAGLERSIETLERDMRRMDFPNGSFDVVWCEGAIYCMGFEAGLRRFAELVRPGGYLAVSEAVWLRPDPPEELRRFWLQYPEIDTVDAKRRVVARLGLEEIGHFVLPPSAWTEPYYEPLSRRMSELASSWQGHELAQEVLKEAQDEIEVFRQYAEYYGYAFFVVRVRGADA